MWQKSVAHLVSTSKRFSISQTEPLALRVYVHSKAHRITQRKGVEMQIRIHTDRLCNTRCHLLEIQRVKYT